jgi:hypothetical protein
MLRRRNGQRGLWEVLRFGDLEPEKQMDPRLRRIDEVLKDETLVDAVLEAMRRRFPQSGRAGAMERLRKWRFACWFSSTSRIGATSSSSGR